MTAVASPDRAKPAGKRTGARLPRLAMLAVRDLRGNLRSFWVFLSCLALGVAAITGVGTLADAVRSGLDTQGRVLLGGDIAVARVHVRANEAERRWLNSKGKVSEIAMLRAMARKPGGVALGASALAEIKAVDAAYPLTGTLTTADGQDASALLRDGASAIVDRLLAERLGIGIGDRLMLGDGEVVIKDYVGQEPDKLASQAAYGPRVLISLDTLARTGLAKPGSLTRWVYRILAPDGEQLGASGFEAFRAALRLRLPEAGFSVTDRRDPAPGARRAVDRLGQFLTLVGLTTLLIGGAGVANAVTTYLDKKRRTIAVFRALGASRRDILVIYQTEILLLAGLGIGLGLLIGTALPIAGNALLGTLLPFPLDIRISPGTVLPAAAYGVLVALLFAFWPLGRTEQVSAALLFRDEINAGRARPRWPFVAAMLVALALVAAIALITAEDRRLALYFMAGLAALFAIFLGFGAAVPRNSLPDLANPAGRSCGSPSRTSLGLARSPDRRCCRWGQASPSSSRSHWSTARSSPSSKVVYPSGRRATSSSISARTSCSRSRRC